MKVFVTGASGFVGKSLIPVLLEQGHGVYGLVRSDQNAAELSALGAHPVKGDLLNVSLFADELNGIDVLVHLGALVKFSGPYREFEKLNVESTRELVNHAVTAGIRKLIYVGAAAVALNGEDQVAVTEDYRPPKRLDNNYLLSKLKAEEVLLTRRNEIQVIILRAPVIWGSGMRIMEKFRPTIKMFGFPTIGDVNHRMSVCHVSNLTAGILCALHNQKVEGIFHIRDGENVQVRNFMKRLIAGYGMSMGNIHLSKKVTLTAAGLLENTWRILRIESDPPLTRFIVHLFGNTFIIDDSRIKDQLGYKPVISVSEGMRMLE